MSEKIYIRNPEGEFEEIEEVSSIVRFASGRMGVWERQTPIIFNQGGPVQNTWYPLFAATENMRIDLLVVEIETANETLNVELTQDGGTPIIGSISATAGTEYAAMKWADPTAGTETLAFTNAANSRNQAFLTEGRSISARIRKTTALGAGDLNAIVSYSVKRLV